MDIEKFCELYKTIMEKYSWKRMIDDCLEPEEKRQKGRKPKYVRFSLGTRDGQIWSATFDKTPTETIGFRLDDEKEIQAMFDWLNGSDDVT